MSDWEDQLKNIMQDNQSGSGDILKFTIRALEDHLQNSPQINPGELIVQLNTLFASFPGMAILFNFINSLFLKIEEEKLVQRREIAVENLLGFLQEYKNQWDKADENIATNLMKAVDLSRKTILLHSNSSSICKTFELLSGKKIFPDIFQTVSYPAKEGKIQAENLSKLGFQVNFISDASIAKYTNEIDLAIFGSDALFPDHFVNKTGTNLYASFFHTRQKSVIVLGDSRKLINENKIPDFLKRKISREEAKNPEEIWQNAPGEISVLNTYFEDVPYDLIDHIVLENGIFSQQTIKAQFKDYKLSELFNFNEQTGF